MINITEELNKKFNNKYDFLKLLNVVYDMEISSCVITFLYPYTIDEINSESREEIENYIQELLSLNGSIKIKYKKSFLDEKLFVNECIEYFKENKKGIFPYISYDNISSSHDGLDVKILINLNQDVLSLLDEFELKTELKEYLDKLFIANISIDVIENEEKLPEEIEAEDIIPTSTKARRYQVNVEKTLIGGEIIPKPEYIKDIKGPKASVILSGFLTNKTQKSYIAKRGKQAGKEKYLYTFNLKDNDLGNMECVYFCSKAHEKDMEELEDMTMVLCVGDVRIGLNGKLSYMIRKLSLASPCEVYEEVVVNNIIQKHKRVVFPDILPRKTQSNLFEEKPKYNDYILNNNFVVFDLETTGLDPETCEITEIGAVKIEHGEITERFSSFAKPKNPIPEEVTKLTNITNEMVANAPKIEDIIQDFYDWSKDCILSGYNIISFDMKFVKKVASKIGIKFENEIIDAFIVAKMANLRLSNYKLGTVVKGLGLTLEDAHRAFNDAYATAEVLMALNKVKETKEIL